MANTPLARIRLMTVAEVASALRVSKMTVYRLIHSGRLDSCRVGRSFRIPESAAEEFFRAARVHADTPATPPQSAP